MGRLVEGQIRLFGRNSEIRLKVLHKWLVTTLKRLECAERIALTSCLTSAYLR